MGITHKNVVTKTKPDVVRIIFEIVDGGWSDQRYSTPELAHTRDHGPWSMVHAFPVSQMSPMTLLQSILLYIILLLCISVHTVMVVIEQALHTKRQGNK